MPTITGRAINVVIEKGDDAAWGGEAAAGNVKLALVTVDHSATALAAGDTLSTDVATAIELHRSGKTVTPRSVSMAQAAYDSTNSRSLAGKTFAVSGDNATFIPTTNDWTTTAAIAAADVLTRPYILAVGYTEA